MAATKPQTPSVTRALGYVRVSTDEQVESGAGLDAQERAIREECERRGWELVEPIMGEAGGASGKDIERAGLQDALGVMDRHGADVLVVFKLDRLSRSFLDGAAVMARASRKGWGLVALDFGLDTTTPAGEMVAHILLAAAQYERRLIGQRTKEGLAEKREDGRRLGAPQKLPDDVVRRIVMQRELGRSLPAIGEGLELDQVPTARGGTRWHPSTVQAVLQSMAAAPLMLGPGAVQRIKSERAAGRTVKEIAQGLQDDELPRPGGTTNAWYRTAVAAVLPKTPKPAKPGPVELVAG